MSGGSWAFDLDAFKQEMLPLVVMVPVVSLFSYFVITGAVRQHRRHPDSGQKYKNLVRAVRQIGDLQEDRIKSLRDYPELRDSLLKLRQRMTKREEALDEREAAIGADADKQPNAPGARLFQRRRREELTATDAIKADADLLVKAVKRGPINGFGQELELSTPELKGIETAIRDNLLEGGVSMTTDNLGEQMRHIRSELADSTSHLRSMIGELSAEMVENQDGAKEIERQLTHLKTLVAGDDAETGSGTADGTVLVDRLDQASAALADLGEETKSIAINTALQAGQTKSGLTELVKLADDVRDVAAKFNGVSSQYAEVGRQIRVAVQAAPGAQADPRLAEAINATLDRVTYWLERAMILGEKFNAFELNFADMTAAFDSKLGGGHAGEAYQAMDDFAADRGEVGDDSGDIDYTGASADGTVSLAGSQPVAGLDTTKGLFEEIGSEADDNLFADIPEQDAAASASESSHTGLTGVFERDELQTPDAEEPETPEPAGDGALTGEPGTQAPPTDDAWDASQPREPGTEETTEPYPPEESATSEMFEEMESPVPQPQTASSTTESQEEDVYDLYELGAVDYEPSLHGGA